MPGFGFDEGMATQIWAPFVAWGSEYREITASEAMQAEATGGSGGRERAKAAEFLKEQLCKGPRRVERPHQGRQGGSRHIGEDAQASGGGPQHQGVPTQGREELHVGVAATR